MFEVKGRRLLGSAGICRKQRPDQCPMKPEKHWLIVLCQSWKSEEERLCDVLQCGSKHVKLTLRGLIGVFVISHSVQMLSRADRHETGLRDREGTEGRGWVGRRRGRIRVGSVG